MFAVLFSLYGELDPNRIVKVLQKIRVLGRFKFNVNIPAFTYVGSIWNDLTNVIHFVYIRMCYSIICGMSLTMPAQLCPMELFLLHYCYSSPGSNWSTDQLFLLHICNRKDPINLMPIGIFWYWQKMIWTSTLSLNCLFLEVIFLAVRAVTNFLPINSCCSSFICLIDCLHLYFLIQEHCKRKCKCVFWRGGG